tara:strand:+ start:226 stop:528 length:303 start_codon:yes stop_codon:yes gene_type:complete
MSDQCALKGYTWSKNGNCKWCVPNIKICDCCGIVVCWTHYTTFNSKIGKRLYTSCDRCIAENNTILVDDQVISPRDYLTRTQIQRCVMIYNASFTKAARK